MGSSSPTVGSLLKESIFEIILSPPFSLSVIDMVGDWTLDSENQIISVIKNV